MSIGTRGLDTIIVFFVRSTIVALKRLLSSGWVPAEAHVTKAAWHQVVFFGCDTATVQYKYSVEGQEYGGTSVQPFFDGGWPDGPVLVLPHGTTTQIRYDPKDPSRSILVERWWITRRGPRV
jgi:hypothetical protein